MNEKWYSNFQISKGLRGQTTLLYKKIILLLSFPPKRSQNMVHHKGLWSMKLKQPIAQTSEVYIVGIVRLIRPVRTLA